MKKSKGRSSAMLVMAEQSKKDILRYRKKVSDYQEQNGVLNMLTVSWPVGWSCRIHRLLLCRRVRSPQWVSWYDTKQSNGEVKVMLELWRMQSTSSLPLLPGPLWPRMVAPDRALSMGYIELNGILMLNWIAWIRTVWLNWIG